MNSIICWDLDETVGYFRKLTGPESLPYFLTKPGIRIFLKELSNRNYVNVLTTAAGISYALRALEIAELKDFFTEVFDECSVRQTSDGKCYQAILKRFGLSPLWASEHMLVIGDRAEDKPVDVPNVVFVEHPEGYRCNCFPVQTILSHLESGAAGFFGGFQRLFERSGDWKSEDDSVTFRLGYRPLNWKDSERTTPVIYEIKADEHFEGDHRL